MAHKRRRPILACVECHRRKVKCDRNYPTCLRCEKAGMSQSCSYQVSPTINTDAKKISSLDDLEEDSSSGQRAQSKSTREKKGAYRRRKSPNQGRTDENQPESLKDNIMQIASYVKSPGARPISSEMYLGLAHPNGPGSHMSGLQAKHDGNNNDEQSHADLTSRLPDHAFRTRYYGPSCLTAMLLQRQELSDFVRRLLRHISSSSSRRKQMISSSLKKKRSGKKNRASQIWEKEDLISLLPSRARADSLIQTYLDVFETTYRVFHVPNFLRRYNDFWKSPTDTEECFILHILLAMATVNAFVHDGSERNDEDRRKQAKKSIRAAESWLRVQSQKWVTLDIFQIHVTLFHAKKLNWVEFKSSWESIGTLVRLSMAAGLHRDPTYLSQKMPVFEAEMRRRLWYTILELEVQEACDRGMQPMLSADNWDCMPPSNIHDEDIGEMTIVLPPERDLHEYTRTSFLCTAQKHLPLRLEVLNKSNSLKNGIDVDLARKYVETLQGLVEGLPDWPETRSSAVANVLSRLVLYEQLMILQQPFAIIQDTGLDHHRSFYFRATQRQMAIDVMSLYSSLPRSEALQIFTMRGDSFRAVLAMCYEAVQSSGAMNSELYNHEAEIHLLEETMTLFADRVRTLHKGFQLYWLVSAAVGLVKVRYSKVPNDDLVAAETVLDAFALLEQINQCTGTNNLDQNHGIDPRLNSIEVTGNMQDHQESHTVSSAINMFDPDTFFAGLVDMDFSPDWLLRFDDPYSCPTINDLQESTVM